MNEMRILIIGVKIRQNVILDCGVCVCVCSELFEVDDCRFR